MSRFSAEYFGLTVPNFSVGKLLMLINFGYRKSLDKRGVGLSEYQDSRSKIFCLTVPETFVEDPLWAVFQKVSKSEKVYGSEAGRRVSSFSGENFLSHIAEKLRTRTFQCFTNFGYRKVLSFGGLYYDIPSNIFVSQW